jgi:hypothetical protein
VRVEESTEADTLGALLIDEMESRKENCHDRSPRSEVNSATDETAIRKVSQSYSTTSSGAKRQRVVTPVPAKVIDVEDERRSSPTSRKISRGTVPESPGEGEKKVLSEIENIR